MKRRKNMFNQLEAFQSDASLPRFKVFKILKFIDARINYDQRQMLEEMKLS